MTHCKDSVEITMQASILDVPPEEESHAAPGLTALDPGLVARGATVFRSFGICHAVGEGATQRPRPELIWSFALVERSRPCNPMTEPPEVGRVWKDRALTNTPIPPTTHSRGTNLRLNGLKEDDIPSLRSAGR